jgi:hypothetical protein
MNESGWHAAMQGNGVEETRPLKVKPKVTPKAGPNKIQTLHLLFLLLLQLQLQNIPPNPPEGGLGVQSLFLIFWECYPLKVKKPKALAAFLKLKPDGALLDRMLEAIDRQKQSRAWCKNNGQFIPHPASWLNNRQWEDSIVPDLGEGSVWDEFIEPDKEES